MLLELLQANGGNSDIDSSCSAVRPTEAGAKAEVELDVTLNVTAGFVVFTPKVLSITVLQKIPEGMLLDEADMISSRKGWCRAGTNIGNVRTKQIV